jgi:hypothetical protein
MFFAVLGTIQTIVLTSLRLREPSPTYRYALKTELGIRGDYSESAL